MFDFDSLIGLKSDDAVTRLHENGYNKTKIIINSKKNDIASDLLVAKASLDGEVVLLICGEFCLNVER